MTEQFRKSAAISAWMIFASNGVFGQNALYIPDTLDGPVYNLTAQTGVQQFVGGNNTPTYGYNGTFLGPTLLMNQGDFVTLNVTNNLPQETTVHWHGFHVSPENDGGPHQIIPIGGNWSPAFEVLNEAGTFWYHPHGEGKTEIQISRGLAGMIIVRDDVEATYTLPRTYGVDDFPLIVQSKAFDVLYQFATANHEDSVMMVNGTIDPYLEVPQQVVRLRLLNASADRTYYFGLSDNSNFNIIASDGGLLSAPYSTNRLRLSTGERAEILVDLSSYSIGSQIYLMSYASELPQGIIGADTVGVDPVLMGEGYYTNYLNGLDFNVLRLDVIAQTSDPVTTIPISFAPKIPFLEADAAVTRTIVFDADTTFSGEQAYVDGPFLMNNTPFHMDSVNYIVNLNDIEIWELVNLTMVAHPFHIHDIEFYVLDINGSLPLPEYQGLKDVILVEPGDTVRFITQFTTFANSMVPYMYHCHLLHHEDEGMMGAFRVVDSLTIGIDQARPDNFTLEIYPNPSRDVISVKVPGETENVVLTVFDSQGNICYTGILSDEISLVEIVNWSTGIYLFQLRNGDAILTKRIVIN